MGRRAGGRRHVAIRIMSIILEHLLVSGSSRPSADIVFDPIHCLIRGPSDTGKSYIRDCLWYLLGGDRTPKSLPEAEGYDSLALVFSSETDQYVVKRGLAGGGAAVARRAVNPDGSYLDTALDEDVGELLVRLSGAGGKQLLRSTSEKGLVTGGDLRHWFLLSQPAMISEDPTSGSASFEKTQRIAAFHLFLTGNDDAAIELRKSNAEVERIKGQLTSAEEALQRIQSGVPSDAVRKDYEDAFEKVEATLTAMNSQYDARATNLRHLRMNIAKATSELRAVTTKVEHSNSMVDRFELLDAKYSSDLARLGATSEGIGFFEALPETPCPLCGTSVEKQLDPNELKPGAPAKYRVALAAEAQKVSYLRAGLQKSLGDERHRVRDFLGAQSELLSALDKLEGLERSQLRGAQIEFAADPKTMARRHSELTAQLGIFDETDRLKAEIERLKRAKVRKRVQVTREGGQSSAQVAQFAKELLREWGFADLSRVDLDPLECDLLINGRPRLSYGAGKRSIFLCALVVAMLRHCMSSDFPHLGAVIIDSPLKAYADPSQSSETDVPAATVTERFYSWLSRWNGPGQVVILENEKIQNNVAKALNAIQFTGTSAEGRVGFYPSLFPAVPPSKS
jgi:hypothetical protein